MVLDFFKYHGTGNDFILLDNRKNDIPEDTEFIQRLCDRKFGIGADGVILLSYKRDFDFLMSYYNSDGLPGTMCGNGGRCVVAFANQLKIIHDTAKFMASDGVHEGRILDKKNNIWYISLSMNDVNEIQEADNNYVIDTGSPHYVQFVNNLNEFDVFAEGKRIRNNTQFSTGGINVNFVEIEDSNIFVRTYERGVENETLSCGTGVIASALSSALRTDKEKCIDVKSRGGMLKVYFEKEDNRFSNIRLEGPATFVFKGKLEI